jgi:septum formation protein
MASAFIYLASASPRRRELLTQIGVQFRTIGVSVDETVRPGEIAGDYVGRLAAAKAEAGWQAALREAREPGGALAPALGADTTVVLDGSLLGKPADAQDAARMLGSLAGRAHEVLTAVALCDAAGTRLRTSRSEVRLRAIDADECRAYAATGEPLDKAGGYAIQGFGAVFVEHIGGSYSGVMGLPVFETAALLREAGVSCWTVR